MTTRTIKSPLIGLALAGLTILPAGAAEQQRTNRWFQKIDMDANGAISLREFLKKRGQQFAKLDFNKNGSVTQAEYSNSDVSMRRFSDLDLNGDNEVKFDEYLFPSRKRFHHLDEDGDSSISEDELDLFREKMRAQYSARKRHVDLRPPSTLRFAKLSRLDNED